MLGMFLMIPVAASKFPIYRQRILGVLNSFSIARSSQCIHDGISFWRFCFRAPEEATDVIYMQINDTFCVAT